jgi:two-component system, NtrC family, sensor kinase
VRVRYFGLLLLLAVGVVPVVGAGLWIVNRAESTALSEVRAGNRRVATEAVAHIGTYVDDQIVLLQALGVPMAKSVGLASEQLTRIARIYQIVFPTLRSLDLVGLDADCTEIATARIDDPTLHKRCADPAVAMALKNQVYLGDIKLSQDFAPLMTIAVPIEVAGKPLGAIVAQVDMVSIWDTIKGIRVGQTGFARLIARDGTLVGHGNPEERRRVFLREKDPSLATIKAAPPEQGARYLDSQKREVIAIAAVVPKVGWTLVVEQPVAEAFAGVRLMRRDLWLAVGLAAILALVVGLAIGRGPVQSLEAMRLHAREVSKGNLASRITDLSMLLEMKQLAIGMNEMAEELHRLQEDMKSKERLNTFARVAAGLAHDLQTPIESIRGACDLMLARPQDDAAREMLASAARNHLPRLHRYVRDLRRLAHDGKVPLELQAIDPRALAERVAQDASSSPKWMGVEFEAEGDASSIWADESLLARAMSNLVGNAADACVQRRPPQGTVTIRVSDDADKGSLVIEVQDTGVGIPADKLADLMVNDFRSTKRNSGVGLGLGVARHVASSHGGTITAESEEGIGSTFRMSIPRQTASGIAATDSTLRKGGQG